MTVAIRYMFFVGLLILQGCSNTSSIVVGDTRPPTNPEEVKVYLTAPDTYEEVALLESNSKGAWAPGDQAKTNVVIERLKREAASLGANGILLTGTQDVDGLYTAAGNSGVVTPIRYKAGSAIAIFVP